MLDFLPEKDIDEMMKDKTINHVAESYYNKYEEETEEPLEKEEFVEEYIDEIILGAYMFKSHFLVGLINEIEEQGIEIGEKKQKSNIIVPGDK